MIRKVHIGAILVAIAFIYLATPCDATVPLPQAWWDFDNVEGQSGATYDGYIPDNGGIGLDLVVTQYNGAGSPYEQTFFAAGSAAEGNAVSPYGAPEHYVTNTGASFDGSTGGTNYGYHMEGGTWRAWEDPSPESFPFEYADDGDFAQDDGLDPRTSTPLLGAPTGGPTSGAGLEFDLYSARDRLSLAPLNPADAGGLLNSSGTAGGILTYAFWLNIISAGNDLGGADNDLGGKGLTWFSDYSFVIGRGSGADNGFSGEVAVKEIHAGILDGYTITVRNDETFNDNPASGGGGSRLATEISTDFEVGNEEWHHWVVQYDLTDPNEGHAQIWLDGGTANGGYQGQIDGLGSKPINGTFSLNEVAHPGATLYEHGNFYIDDLGVWSGTLLTDADVSDIYNDGLSDSLTGQQSFLSADADKDGDVDTADLTKMFQNFTGDVPGGTGGQTMFDGDTDGDRDVDTADITAGFQQFTGALAGLADNPDLVYDPSTGNVKIFADGASVGSFNLQSAAQFLPPADFSDLDDDNFPFPASVAVDNTTSAIGWVSSGSLAGFGFDGPAGTVNTPFADLGNIFPTGLDLTGLEALLTANDWAPPLNGGTPPSSSFDLVIVPEPSSILLLVLGLAGMFGLCRFRRR